MGRSTTSQRKAAIKATMHGTERYNRHEYLKAEEAFMKALEEDPGYARAHLYLGNTLHKLGRQEEAAAQWKKAVIVEPDSESAEKARQKLDGISSGLRGATRNLEEWLRR
ncbi:MAG: tetratricopeptide repeat protein [Candidatus Hydrogenedentes bacterium]|nr:tetratricopeptide repeat protein [Candidatus Hydrogenedentota bacterium]